MFSPYCCRAFQPLLLLATYHGQVWTAVSTVSNFYIRIYQLGCIISPVGQQVAPRGGISLRAPFIHRLVI